MALAVPILSESSWVMVSHVIFNVTLGFWNIYQWQNDIAWPERQLRQIFKQLLSLLFFIWQSIQHTTHRRSLNIMLLLLTSDADAREGGREKSSFSEGDWSRHECSTVQHVGQSNTGIKKHFDDIRYEKLGRNDQRLLASLVGRCS